MIRDSQVESILLTHPLLVGDTLRIRLGTSLKYAFYTEAELAKRIKASGTDKYLVTVVRKPSSLNTETTQLEEANEIAIVFHKQATPVDQLRAFFQACYLQRLVFAKCKPDKAPKYFDEPLNSNGVVFKRALKIAKPSFTLTNNQWEDLLDDSWRYTYANFDTFLAAVTQAQWRTNDIILCGPPKTTASWTFANSK